MKELLEALRSDKRMEGLYLRMEAADKIESLARECVRRRQQNEFLESTLKAILDEQQDPRVSYF